MRKILALLLSIGCWVGWACTTVPEDHFFTMAYSLLPNKMSSKLPATVRVRQFSISPAYEQDRIVYRYSPYEFQYYNYMLWAVKPQKMITDLLIQHLQHSALFSAVLYEYGERRPDFELSGDIQAIEELDAGDEWFAHLAFTVRMNPFGDEKTIWSYAVDARKKVYSKSPVYVVKALSELMEEETEKMLKDLGDFYRGRKIETGVSP